MPDAEGHPTLAEMELGVVLAALADSYRRRVVEDLLADERDAERTCSSFGLPVTKSTLTHHFRVLREAGLIRQVDRGNCRTVTLRHADVEARFPGLLDVIHADASTRESS